MKIKDLKEKTKQELQELLSERRKKIRELKFGLASGKVKNVRELHVMRRDIARIFTLINTQA
ncbi:50S ribosomal protein L29 [Candidatus Parcubacteria bacterium]|nr:MAG: 50S ribosomal protein L29 [Candidatus Parcubacteria bacterium]